MVVVGVVVGSAWNKDTYTEVQFSSVARWE